LKRDVGKPLGIDAIETALHELLEHYRQALCAAELLPAFGPVPKKEFLAEIAQPLSSTQSRIARLWTPLLRIRNRHADWVSSRFAIRFLVRMFLCSHIRSKLRTVADRLETEWLAIGDMDANTRKRLDTLIRELRTFDERLPHGSTKWLKSLGWLWAIVAPLLTTYLSTFVIANHRAVVAGILVRLGTYLLMFALMVVFPLSTFGALGGFRWKRLILVGQTGDVNTDVAAVLCWAPSPLANTYQSENRLFETLGMPKPSEFPWDRVLLPQTLLLAALSLAFLVLAIAISISATKSAWPMIVAIVLVFVSFFCLRCILRAISTAIRERVKSGIA